MITLEKKKKKMKSWSLHVMRKKKRKLQLRKKKKKNPSLMDKKINQLLFLRSSKTEIPRFLSTREDAETT